jgi:hypothetical protein
MLKESRYVRLANTMYRILRNSRTPLFLHRKSNHVFTVWQHLVLLTIRQYEAKSYRMFVEWLVEAYYLREFLQLSHIYLILQHCKRAQTESIVYAARKDNFFIHHTYRYKTYIRRNRFNWIQGYTCITILYREREREIN